MLQDMNGNKAPRPDGFSMGLLPILLGCYQSRCHEGIP